MVHAVDEGAVLLVLREAADAVRGALDELSDWGPSETVPGQYRSDVVADRAALAVLHAAGMAVFSEESGSSVGDGPGGRGALTVVLDPVDGSTNASLGLPWYATSLCVLDAEGPWVALVVNQASGVAYEAARGLGARRDGAPIAPSSCTSLGDAVLAMSGFPAKHLGWRQFRALGAAALDICAVADGSLDGYLAMGDGALSVWDYVGALLVATEAGAVVTELEGAELVVTDRSRRQVVAGATDALVGDVVRAAGGSAAPAPSAAPR